MLGIFLDLEATGLDFFRHKVIDLAISVLHLTTGERVASYNTRIARSKETWDNSDPNSLKVNGCTWEMIQQGKKEEVVRQEILEFFNKYHLKRGNCCFICQNPSFDRSFFAQVVPSYDQERELWPYHWMDFASMHFALHIKENGLPENFAVPLSKDTIAHAHNIPSEEAPHTAENGVEHLITCYKAVVGFPHTPKRSSGY